MKNAIANINRPGSIEITGTPNNKTSSYSRKIIVGALVSIAVAALIHIVFDTTVTPGSISLQSVSVIIPVCCYTLLGVCFTAFLYSGLGFVNKSNYEVGLAYSLSVFAGVFAALLFIGFMKGNGSVTTSLFYSSLFLLPYTIYQTWHFYTHLSLISYNKIWYLPEHTSQVPVATVFLNSVNIKLKLSPEYGDTEQVYETTVPGRMTVGNMFINLINEENSRNNGHPVFKDVNNKLFGWQFFAPGFLGIGTRVIDTDASLDENRIRNNTVIRAKRVARELSAKPIDIHR